MLKVRIITLALTLAWVSANAQTASISTAHDTARQALAAQNFGNVVQTYQSLGTQADIGAIGHYRLAIAQGKLNNPQEAFKHINIALELDPKAAFASTPQRLEKILADIQQGCETIGPLGCLSTNPPPPPIKALGTLMPSSAAAVMPTPMASRPVSTSSAPVASSQASPAVAPKNKDATAGAFAFDFFVDRSRDLQFIAAGVTGFAIVFLLSIWATRAYKKRKTSHLDELHLAVHQHLALCPPDSKIFVKLQELLPLIEQEVGRQAFSHKFDLDKLAKADRRQVQLALKYEKVPMNIATATPEEIQALFQSTRWN